jgi:NAD+ synthase
MSLREEILRYSRQDTMAPLSDWFDNLLTELIDSNVYADQNQLEEIGRNLVAGVKDYGKKHYISNVAIGMSGGVDSALTAAMFKQAGWNVFGVTMPIHQNPAETDRGVAACRALGIEHKQVDLTKMYDTLLAEFQKHDDTLKESTQNLRRGNLRVRLRMMTIYNEASRVRGLVASTDNFSELAAGFWTLHGDVGDLAPIQSLSKSWEVPRLAEMFGVPSETVFAKPTDGLGISDGDEAQFGFSYLEFDLVLLKLCQADNLFTYDDCMDYLAVPESDKPKVERILRRISMSTFKRTNPYNLTHPSQTNRYPGLNIIDKALWE